MHILRLIAATLAAALMALGLSVGAALAEGEREPGRPAGKSHFAASGLCLLDDVAR